MTMLALDWYLEVRIPGEKGLSWNSQIILCKFSYTRSQRNGNGGSVEESYNARTIVQWMYMTVTQIRQFEENMHPLSMR